MDKIRILFCLPHLAHGGTERQLISLINGLNRKRFVPYLCCTRKSIGEQPFASDASLLFGAIDCPKLQLDITSFKKISSYLYIMKLAKYIRVNDIQLIVSYFVDPTIISFLSSKLSLHNPINIVNFRDLGLLRSTQPGGLMKWIYNHIHYFIANSQAVKKDYVNNESISAEKIKVIYNGIQAEKFTRLTPSTRKPSRIGIIANLNRSVKRVDIFLLAASQVYKNHPNVSFIVIGDGALKPQLAALAANLGIDHRVDFVGRTTNIQEHLAGIHIGVNTSETEGFSNVILEFLVAGIPVIATESGGNREIIVNNKNGFLFPVGDFKALAERLQSMLDDHNSYLKLSENSRKSVVGRFENSIMIQNYETFFEEIMRKNKFCNIG